MAIAKKSGSSRYKYREREPDSVKKRAEQDSGAFDSIFKSGVDTWRAKVGDNLIRFVPPTWEDPDHYGYDVWTHNYIGADSGSYLCPKKMLNKRCPICEAQKEAADAGETEEAKALKATKKVAAWIIDRDDDNPSAQVYLMSWTMDRDIAALCHNKRTGKVLMIDNPETGYDVTIKRAGAGLKTRYFGMAIDRDPSAMMDSQKEINAIMEYAEENPINTVLLYKSADYLESVVDGTAAKKDPDETEDKPSKKRRSAEPDEEEEERPAKRRRAEPEDEEEEKPAKRKRAEPEEPEEEERPAKRRRSEPEEEPEEEERPAKRRRAADPDDDDAEERPAKRRRSEPEEEPEEEERPAKRRRDEPEDEEEEKPSRRRRPEPEEEPEEERPAKRRRAEPEDEPEEEERPAKRRRAEPEDEEEEKPVKRRRV